MTDRFKRRITYLRLSVTDRCNLRCAYCMPDRMTFQARRDLLSVDELLRLADAFIERGVTQIRLTGGEPLVRRDAMQLVSALGQRLGRRLEELTLTTNATQLAAHAQAIRAAGVERINISLDTLDRATFARLTRADALPQVLAGIAGAKAAGLRVKLNTVVLKGVNEAHLADLIAWAHGEWHDVSLIEVMPLGDVSTDRLDQYVPLDTVREQLEERWTLRPSTYRTAGPARYVDVAETGGRLGFITPLTENFCSACNRVRVTATGQLHPCLGGGEQVDLRAGLRMEDGGVALSAALDEALRIKPEKHTFAIGSRGSGPAQARHMSVTGG
jgi:cyclic pyranopterin phosphate synthase